MCRSQPVTVFGSKVGPDRRRGTLLDGVLLFCCPNSLISHLTPYLQTIWMTISPRFSQRYASFAGFTDARGLDLPAQIRPRRLPSSTQNLVPLVETVS